jgi:hypothetical protein
MASRGGSKNVKVVDGQAMVPRELVDKLVRARVAEIMSAAGLDQGRIGLEVLWDMPPGFVRAYEWLWRLISEGEKAKGGGGAGGRDQRQAEVGVAGDAPAGRMGGGARGRTRDTERSREGLSVVVVRSGGSARRGSRGPSRGGAALGVAGSGLEDVARLKERIDKRLRACARDIAAELEAAVGLRIDDGEEIVKLDMARVGELRAGLVRAVGNNAIDDDDSTRSI